MTRTQTNGATCLGVFAKHWTPGEVKTRLGSTLGQQLAADIYYELLATTLTRLAGRADHCVVAYTPHDYRDEFSRLASAWRHTPQCSGDLGRRLARFFEERLAAGCDRVVVVGADSPHLSLKTIDAAFDALKGREVVLGPSEDGGYYLVGVRGKTPPIFGDIPWGTSEVWAATMARLQQASVQPAILPGWYDVDSPSDLHLLQRDLARSTGRDAALDRLALRLQALVGEPPDG